MNYAHVSGWRISIAKRSLYTWIHTMLTITQRWLDSSLCLVGLGSCSLARFILWLKTIVRHHNNGFFFISPPCQTQCDTTSAWLVWKPHTFIYRMVMEITCQLRRIELWAKLGTRSMSAWRAYQWTMWLVFNLSEMVMVNDDVCSRSDLRQKTRPNASRDLWSN